MKEKVIESVGDRLNKLNVFIYDVFILEENGEKTLTIVLDSDEMIDLKTVVNATRIINPIVDKLDLISGAYTLDIYAKERNDLNEQ